MSFLADDSQSTYFQKSLLHPGGPVADRILSVFWPIFWVSVVVFVGVSLSIIYCALRFRRKSDDEEPRQIHGNNRLEVAWTLIPFAILISLFLVTFVNMGYINNLAADQKATAINVCVQGERFDWSYIYVATPDCPPLHRTAAGGVTYIPLDKSIPTSTTLVVPAGHPVQLKLVSTDVNHSFFIPSLAGQVNAIPGQTNEMWFQVDQPGLYHGACTELCGEGHYSMLVCIDAKSESDYFQWVNDKKAGKTSSVKVAACVFPPPPGGTS